MSQKRVEVLFFERCPNVATALARAREAIAAANVLGEIHLVSVDTDEDAKRFRFLGSPPVRVDGIDVDGSASARDDFALQCRIYSVNGCVDGAPPADWIARALRGESNDHGAAAPVRRGSCACEREP